MNLWPVEHSTDPAKKWGKKCSTGQRFICTEVTSYKIHILEPIRVDLSKSYKMFKNTSSEWTKHCFDYRTFAIQIS